MATLKLLSLGFPIMDTTSYKAQTLIWNMVLSLHVTTLSQLNLVIYDAREIYVINKYLFILLFMLIHGYSSALFRYKYSLSLLKI